MRKFLVIFILALLILGGAFFWWRYMYVFGQGVKAGNLNILVYKGYVWKTWEGRLIQEGFRAEKGNAGFQSNEFEFSVVNDSVAHQLERASGKFVELKYKEYQAPLPWRGMSRYVVDEVLSISDERYPNTLTH